jgi:hypothetical protein
MAAVAHVGAGTVTRAAGARWGRNALGLRVAAGATLCALGVMVATGTAGAANDKAPAKPFVNGDVTAVSQALEVQPKTGGFAFTVTVGTSIADYRDTLAQASSQSLNLGLLGTALTTQQCNGSAAALKPNQLPQPLVAESDHGTQHQTATTGPASKSGVLAAAGQEAVTATTQPSAAATFAGGSLGIPGIVTMSGFDSTSTAHLVGHTREAASTAEIHSIDIAGKVQLDDLVWTATQRTGAQTAASGSFHVGGLTVAGKSEHPTPANLAAAFTAVNRSLAETGLHVDQPSIVGHGSAVAVTPLTVGIDNSKVGKTLVSPVLTTAQPVIDLLTNALLGITCSSGNALTVADLGLGTLDGTGSTDVLFGGASVGTQVVNPTDPFGPQKLGRNPSTVPIGKSGNDGSQAPGPASSAGLGKSGSAAPVRHGATGRQPAVATPAAASSTTCSTTSLADWPSCSTGHAVGVGLIALGALALLGGGDLLVLRRRRLPPVSL